MNRRKMVGVICGFAVVAAVVAWVFFRSATPQGAALTARERAMEALGARISKLRPGCKVLALGNPFTKQAGYLNEKSQYERAGLHGLHKGLGGRSTVTVVFPEIRPEYVSDPQSVVIPPDCRTPLSFLMRAASVDALAQAHPECQVLVSLIGLPVGVEDLKIWSEKDPRCFALLLPDLRLLGTPAEAARAFEREKLLAVVVEEPQSGKPLVVTRDNLAEVLKHHPRSLGY